MIDVGMLCLMYHELRLPSRPLCHDFPGYTRYAVTEDAFRSQLTYLKSSGLPSMSLSRAMVASATQPSVVITFDDGCETDLICAAPLLKDADCDATFYVIAGFVGRRGYLDKTQLRAIVDLGFEIGCHSMTHAYLSDLGEDQLRVEVWEAKRLLEDFIGRRIDHLSCPGGRWSRRVVSMAREAGFRTVSTSRIGMNTLRSDPFRLARIAVMDGTSLTDFIDTINGRGLLIRRAKDYVLSAAKGLLGNSLYERVRSAALGRP